MRKWKSLSRMTKFIIIGIGILFSCIFFAIVGTFLTDSETEPLNQDDLVLTAMAEIVATSEAEKSSAPETPSEEPFVAQNVYFVCGECIFSDGTITTINMWETPDDIGSNESSVSHGEECLLLDTTISQEGIGKGKIQCASGEGWVRAEAIYIPENDRCVPASSQQISRLLSWIEDVEPNNYLANVVAVRSSDFERVWMVAGEINGNGIDSGEVIGVWAINGELDSPGITLSVNSYASVFSEAPLGSGTEAQITMNSEGAKIAENCSQASN